MDALLVEAMNNLTFEERQEQQEVLHGVDDTIEEDAHFTEQALKSLDDHLLRQKYLGSMYGVAESMDPEYVRAREFRLMFLRSDRYDAEAAADRMIRFFDIKHKLFGRAKLVKDITMEDLDEDDIACIKTGALQPAGKDLSGRQVLVLFPGLRKFKKFQLLNELRAHYYISMSLVKSKATLIRGKVMIIYAIGDALQDKSGGRGYAECAALQLTIPPFKAAIHGCFDSLNDYVAQSVAMKLMPMKTRARGKLHYGSHTECQYRLSTFGILPGLLPLTPATNRMNLERHLEWVEFRRMADECGGSNSSIIDIDIDIDMNSLMITTPTPNDVLCRGSTRSNTLGNQLLMELCKEHIQAYGDVKTDKSKRQVVGYIVDKIHETGGRFLKQEQSNASVWEELTPNEVRKKVMQALRNLRRRLDVASKQKAIFGDLIEGEPLPNDVIFSRVQRRNQGTELLQRLIKEHSEEYESLDRGMKITVVESIVQRIQGLGGRFLQPSPENGGWHEITNEAVRERRLITDKSVL
ncbi:MAG: hypothetical protein SGBAC_003118 [Bacillariaceae sp.]